MPSKRPLSALEQIEALKAQIATQTEEIARKDQELEKARRQQGHKRKLIPRPKGQAGRSNHGYNLRKEMKLDRDGTRYQRLSRLVRSYVNQYLPAGKTIAKQEKNRVEKLIAHIQTHVKYFQRFRGGWPIRALIKQYLQNSSDKLKRDLRLERLAEAVDSDDWSELSGSSSKRGEVESEGEEDDDEAEAGDDWIEEEDEGEPEVEGDDLDLAFPDDYQLQEANFSDMDVEAASISTPNRRRSDTKENEPLEYESEAEAFENILKRKKAKGSVKHTTSPSISPSKRKYAPDADDTLPNAKKPRFKALAVTTPPCSPSIKSKVVPKPRPFAKPLPALTRQDLPDTCPANYCKDPVPQNPSREILTLFSERQDLIAKEGKNASGCRELTRRICQILAVENERRLCLETAQEHGWPLKIDFHDISKRVSALSDIILDLASDCTELEESPAWQSFLVDINYKVYAFARAPVGSFSSDAEQGKRCGYFGPHGRSRIISAIQNITSSLHEHQVFQTVSGVIDTPHPWDKFDANSLLLSSPSFIDYILAPHVAACLISEDLKIDLTTAFDVLRASSNFGDAFNGLPDVHGPASAPKSPKQPIKGSKPQKLPSTRKAPKTVTLDNFPPPVVKKPKAKPDATKKLPKSVNPSTSSPSLPRYGTRSSKRK